MIAIVRAEIHPRCDKHQAQMTKVSFTTGAVVDEKYRCQEPGCRRHYDASNGYFDLADGGELSHRFRPCCPSDGSALYCAELDEQTGISTWRCALGTCNYLQLVTDEETDVFPSAELLGE